MKLSKNFYLLFAILFTINFIFCLFEAKVAYKLFNISVSIWVYRAYKLFIALAFIKIYLNKRASAAKN